MAYEAKNFSDLFGIKGLSDGALKTHLALYQGYVVNTNKLLEELSEMVKTDKIATPEFAEFKRRFGWEWNGMRLHEHYFKNMAKAGSPLGKNSSFAKKTAEDFGSFEAWEKDFKAIGAMRGIGWVITYYDSMVNKLMNVWINEHHVGHLSGLMPILVMDVFEHAFMLDYGTKRADYIEAFFKAIDWKIVSAKFNAIKKMEEMYAAIK